MNLNLVGALGLSGQLDEAKLEIAQSININPALSSLERIRDGWFTYRSAPIYDPLIRIWSIRECRIATMDEILWRDLSVISATLDRLCAEWAVHRRLGTLSQAGDLQNQIDELTNRREELVRQLLDRVPSELAVAQTASIRTS